MVVYLNSIFGRKQIVRRAMPSNQVNVSGAELKKIDILLPGIDEQQKIAILVVKAYELRHHSQSLYTQAQELLERELGLDKLAFDKPLAYEARLSEVVGNNRADADYYQIPFKILEKHLTSIKTIRLDQIVNFIKGIEVGSLCYTENGMPFLRVSNIKEMEISLGNSDKYISKQLYDLLKYNRPQIGELLLTKDGTPGVCYAVTDAFDGIISSGIVRLLPKDINFPIEYLALVINSRVCKMQIEQECSGALIIHWKPYSIRKLKIPILSVSIMEKIDKLVSDSKNSQHESRRLLKQAKHRVEELIEEAVRKQ